MGIFKKLFKKNKENNKSWETSVFTENDEELSVIFYVSSSPVGTYTRSKFEDFYVYEWYIEETKEIFYVGKGRGKRYKEIHRNAYEAEKIRNAYKTNYRFVAKKLTEEEAIELESQEMLRILNETKDRLTNRIVPFTAERDNGYGRGFNMPKYEFEKAPVLFVTEIDEHYFGKCERSFDEVEMNNLKYVHIFDNGLWGDVLKVYDGNVGKYYAETEELLRRNATKILKSRYAKSITAWIYIGDEDLQNYEINQKKAIEELGREVPVSMYARWANQPNIFKKMSFRQFCEVNQELHKNEDTLCSSMGALYFRFLRQIKKTYKKEKKQKNCIRIRLA